MSENEEPEYGLHDIPVSIFTEGLDFDQERTLATITEALDRGNNYARELAEGNEELRHEFEPLYRLLFGISKGAVLPILKLISEGARPDVAIRAVIAGVGGMFFFGGIEYAKVLGLDGVGVQIQMRDTEADPKYHPESMPSDYNPSIEDLLRKFTQQQEQSEEE